MKLFFSSKKKLLIPLILLQLISIFAVLYSVKLLGYFIDEVILNGLKTSYIYLVIFFVICILHYSIVAILGYNERLLMLDITKKIMSNKLKTSKSFEEVQNETELYVYDYILPKIRIFWLVIMILSTIIIIGTYSWVVSVVVFSTILITYFIPKVFSKKIIKASKKLLHINNNINKKISLAEKNYQTISIQNGEVKNMLQELSNKKRFLNSKKMFLTSIRDTGSIFIVGIIYLGIFISSAILIYLQKNSIGEFVVATTLVGGFITQIPYLNSMVANIKNNEWISKKKDVVDNEYINKKIVCGNIESIQIKELSSRNIINNVSMNILDDDNVLLVGANGSGKSMLSKILLGIDDKYTGEILINKNMKPNYISMSFIYQSSSLELLPGTVVQNITFFEDVYNGKKVDTIIKMMELDNFKNRNISDLSSGEKALVKIASMFYSGAKVKIYDELLMAIDEHKRGKILDFILNQKSINIIISHSIKKEEEIKFSKKIKLLKN